MELLQVGINRSAYMNYLFDKSCRLDKINKLISLLRADINPNVTYRQRCFEAGLVPDAFSDEEARYIKESVEA